MTRKHKHTFKPVIYSRSFLALVGIGGLVLGFTIPWTLTLLTHLALNAL